MGKNLTQDLTPTPIRVVCLDDGAARGFGEGRERGYYRNIFEPIPGERRRELDQASGAGGDGTGWVAGGEHGRCEPAFGPEEAMRSAGLPQWAALCSGLRASLSSSAVSSGASPQAPTNP